MELSVHSTIAPRAANLTRFKVSGKLPSLAVNFSNLKYKGLMRLIDIAMPDFGNYSHAPSARPANDPDPLKITSNPFLKTEDYVVEDDDHSTVGAEGESDQGYDKLSVGGQSGSEDVSRLIYCAELRLKSLNRVSVQPSINAYSSLPSKSISSRHRYSGRQLPAKTDF